MTCMTVTICWVCREQTTALVAKHFNADPEQVVAKNRLMYGDYMVPGADVRIYSQVTDMTQLVKVSEIFNALSCLFDNKCDHVSAHMPHTQQTKCFLV